MLKPYLPKYFSSEWSHSQFRLPAPAPPASRLPYSLSNPSNYPSSAFSTAGASAAAAAAGGAGTALPTVEDDVCICAWIDGPRDSVGTAGSAAGFASSQLVAITRSGGWFRIAFDREVVPKGDPKGKGRATADERPGDRRVGTKPTDGVIGLDKDSTSDCRVVEYRRFGQEDEW